MQPKIEARLSKFPFLSFQIYSANDSNTSKLTKGREKEKKKKTRKKEDSLSSNFQELISYTFQLSSAALLSRAKRQEAIRNVNVSPKGKLSKFAGGVSALPAFWFSAFGSLWQDHPPLWVTTPHLSSPISELPWEGVSWGVHGKPVFTHHLVLRGRVGAALSWRKGWCAPGQLQTTSSSPTTSDLTRLKMTTSGKVKLGCKVENTKMNNPINKLGKRVEQTFCKEIHKWVTSKQKALSIISQKEVQIKTVTKYHHTATRMAKI